MGLIDAQHPRPYRPRGLLGPVGEETTSTATMQGGDIGPGGGDIRDQQAGRGGLPEYNNASDWMSAMSRTPTGFALDAVTGRGMFGGQDHSYSTVNGDFVNNGMVGLSPAEVAAASASPSNVAGSDLGIQGAGLDQMAGLDAGYAKGGKVRPQGLLGPNPKGPDDGYAALKVGERVLNEKQFGRLTPAAQKEVDGVLKAKKK